MACYHPLTAWRAPPGCVFPETDRRSGKYGKSISFNPVYSSQPGVQELLLPCGRCIGCRLERSRQWAVRCMHEASLYDYNCFITLTYDDNHLPSDMSLNVEDYQLFMKKLRKKYGEGIRFFHCGEYGEKFERPHHHAIIFNFDFPDKEIICKTKSGLIWHSKELSALWDKGFVSIGDVTFDSCAYVARYIMKKITGDPAEEHYKGRMPEYITMSRRPGIAAGWFEKFSSDVYPKDFITVNGFKCKPSRFYDRLYERNHKFELLELKERRLEKALARDQEQFTPDRLADREKAVTLKLNQMTKRSIE